MLRIESMLLMRWALCMPKTDSFRWTCSVGCHQDDWLSWWASLLSELISDFASTVLLQWDNKCSLKQIASIS